MGGGVRDEGNTAVERRVEPLVRVGSPGVGEFGAAEKIAVGGAGQRPQADGPVHVYPAVVSVDKLADLDHCWRKSDARSADRPATAPVTRPGTECSQRGRVLANPRIRRRSRPG